MSRASFFAAAAAGGSIAALCFCWKLGFLRKRTPPSPNPSSFSHVHGPAGFSLLQDPAPEDINIKDEANVGEILVELETPQGCKTELKAEEASGFALVEVSLDSFDAAGESQANEEEEEEEVEDSKTELKAEVASDFALVEVSLESFDAAGESQAEDLKTQLKAEEASVTAVVDVSHESSHGAEESETEHEEEMVVQDAIEDAGDEGEGIVDGGKMVEVSSWDSLIGAVDSEDEHVSLVGEILVELETPEGYKTELKAEGASGFALVEVSLGSFDAAGESQANEEEEVEDSKTELKAEEASDFALVDVSHESSHGAQEEEETELKAEEASVTAVVDISHESSDGAEESQTEHEEEMVVQDAIEDAGDEGEEVVEDSKLVEVSGWDCLVGGVHSEDKRVSLTEEGGGEVGGEPDGVPYQDTSLVECGGSEVAQGDFIKGCEDIAKDGESVHVGDCYLANGDAGECQDEDFKEEVPHEEFKEHLKSNELEVPIEGDKEDFKEGGKQVDLSSEDFLVDGVDSEDEQVCLREEGGGEAFNGSELEVPTEGLTTEANLVMEVVNGTIFYMDPITKNNRGFSLLKFTTLDQAKQELSVLKNSLVDDTPYRVAPNHAEASHEASLVEVLDQTIFYTDPVTKKNNGFSLLQFATLDNAEQGVSVIMNQQVNGTPCGRTPKQDREPLEKEPEEEIVMDVSDRGRRFPPPDQIHGLKHPRASRHATQRGSGIPRMVASEGEAHHRRGSQQRTCAPGQRRMKQMIYLHQHWRDFDE